MKEIIIISGKGGTGKTTVTAAFASLAERKVMADCDVDAADLHLILQPTIRHTEEFRSGKTASIRLQDCRRCARCINVCQFSAISDDYIIDPVACEGCGVCVHFCPFNVIDFNENHSGYWYVSETRFGTLVHAKLGIAEENSGKLVTLVRQQARLAAEEQQADYIIVDGSPGIGCPVISSITGANAVLIVTEPTLSGLHDVERVVTLANGHFRIPTYICVNKFDLNLDITQQIRDLSEKHGAKFVGQIPYDNVTTEAMVAGKNVIEYSDNPVATAIRSVWQQVNNGNPKGM
ncbi:4Fe-4S binding protein [candidate division KSB1 bacterium]|nr:4Fe-4S binding protein [candidate division KSB1 bacterium]